MAARSTISTRFLIISDTHGEPLNNRRRLSADVAVHCGDLTEESKIEEFITALEVLKEIQAPLKLVIAGNHDFTMDDTTYKKKLEEIDIDVDLIRKEYGAIGQAKSLFESEDAKAAGIIFLDEGIHHFRLANGAMLTVYASPCTASLSESNWGFQYDPQQEHDWALDGSVDVAITHCPPRGVLDYTDSRQRAGSPGLFATIARAKPQIHCFGHIHEGWGAKKVTWRSELSETPSHFTDIDNDESVIIESLSGVRAKKFDAQEDIDRKQEQRQRYDETGYVAATGLSLQPGRQTLFVNAAVEGMKEGQQQWPWMVDINLPKAKQGKLVGREEMGSVLQRVEPETLSGPQENDDLLTAEKDIEFLATTERHASTGTPSSASRKRKIELEDAFRKRYCRHVALQGMIECRS